jgi:hypothetical protein
MRYEGLQVQLANVSNANICLVQLADASDESERNAEHCVFVA